MRTTSILFAVATMALALICSCGDESSIGSSLVQDQIEVIVDSSYTVKAKTIPSGSVQSRTTAHLLGRVNASGFGKIESDIVTQFMPASKLFTSEVTVNDIDSLVLYFFMQNGEFIGDSLAPMGLEIYRLDKNLQSPIFSDFNPDGYFNPSKPLASTIYNVSSQTNPLLSDTASTSGIEIKVKLPHEFAREMFAAYKMNPSNFASPSAFSENVFKGFYIKNSFGSGRLMRISNTLMTMYYHRYDAANDTTLYGQGNYFAVTPEIVSNSDVTMEISDEIEKRVEQGEQIVLAPVGLNVELTFPAKKIIETYKSNPNSLTIVNNLSFSFPVEKIGNEHGISIPTYMLLVLKSEKEEFFAKNKIPDNITSFMAEYNSSTGKYDFGEMRSYVNWLLKKDEVKEEDYTFILTPVSAQYETQQSSYYYSQSEQTLIMVTPYMSAPVMAHLKLEDSDISFTFTKQSINK